MKQITKLWIGIAVLIVLSPLGFMLPSFFRAGGAWGEQGPEEIKKITGYVPEKLAKLSGIWKAPMHDYAFDGWKNKGQGNLSFAYICSAVLGILIIAGAVFLIGGLLAKKREKS